MKNIIITFLGIFLLSATMNAVAVSPEQSAVISAKARVVELEDTLTNLRTTAAEYDAEDKIGWDDYSSAKRKDVIKRAWFLDKQIASFIEALAEAKATVTTAEAAAAEAAAEAVVAAAVAAEAEEIKNSKTYCVDLPERHAPNETWTKRDNHIGARWKYKLTDGSVHTVRGNWDGEDVPDRYLHNINHIYYSRGDRPICINYARLQRDVAPSTAVSLWLDVKWGSDCPHRVPNQQHDSYRKHISNAFGTLVRPWSCH